MSSIDFHSDVGSSTTGITGITAVELVSSAASSGELLGSCSLHSTQRSSYATLINLLPLPPSGSRMASANVPLFNLVKSLFENLSDRTKMNALNSGALMCLKSSLVQLDRFCSADSSRAFNNSRSLAE